MRDRIKLLTFKLEESFTLTVIRHGLAMMIPFVLTGAMTSAILNFPVEAYQNAIAGSSFAAVLETIYNGTYGIFSLAMLIMLCASYCMERNMTVDKAAFFLVVGLGAFGVQLYPSGWEFCVDMVGVKGCFFAIFTALIACRLLEWLQDVPLLRLRKYTHGMEGIYSIAISRIFPSMVVIGLFAIATQLILVGFHVNNMYDLVSGCLCGMFDYVSSEFGKGLLYAILVHVMWIFGLHGSHILEPVATTNFAVGVPGEIFSKSFFDIYVVMGGCGTTMCVLLALFLFFRKKRMHNLAKLASFTVVFNINEILTFGIPIILTPVLAIPFLLTPVFCYVTAYGATALGLVPPVTQEVIWSTPVLFSGYLATGSIRGSLLQLFMIVVGIFIYLPFLRLNIKVQERYAKEQMDKIVQILQEKEEANESVDLLSQSNRVGQISRVLCHDLEMAIEQDKLFMLYQPQVDSDGVCIGAEALLRWNHPLYGFIYPPLIIYLAKEGGLLEALERRIIDKTVASIAEVQKVCGGEFKISMNLTAKSLLWDVEGCIAETLKKYDVPASKLWIEITEQDVLSKTVSIDDKLQRLKDAGHVLMIDDFGMGHTSLVYLQSNHFGVVKLDGSLVRDISENKTNQDIVSSIVDLGEKLNVRILAEFVEGEKQRDKLLELGCKWYQGYFYNRPLPLDEFETYMKEHR
ncbi:MAG: EAL domain-containing protein [Lachnospiraceae bacterium]|nr:EAL domain-containing protein [Lachnospiraceae bacterium]